MKMIRLVGVSGSLRRGSNCTAVLRTLQESLGRESLGHDVEMSLARLDELPLYNQDLEGAFAPESVRVFKDEIEGADGLVICSPEYNFGMSGVLKNALDWASRPAFASPLKGKPVLLATCSPAVTGGARAHSQMRDTLAGTLSRVVACRPVVIGTAHTKIQDGRLSDEATIKYALEAIGALIADIAALRIA